MKIIGTLPINSDIKKRYPTYFLDDKRLYIEYYGKVRNQDSNLNIENLIFNFEIEVCNSNLNHFEPGAMEIITVSSIGEWYNDRMKLNLRDLYDNNNQILAYFISPIFSCIKDNVIAPLMHNLAVESIIFKNAIIDPVRYCDDKVRLKILKVFKSLPK